MKIHIGELINLMRNSPVFDGDTLSHSTMADLRGAGLAKRDGHGNIPTDKGRMVYDKLIKSTIEVEVVYKFKF